MRVTVIATGIGLPNEPAMPKRIPRIGKKKSADLEKPAYARKREETEESEDELYKNYKDAEIDSNDLDIPTFLRRKAD
jgi:cell division protein FtsZ